MILIAKIVYPKKQNRKWYVKYLFYPKPVTIVFPSQVGSEDVNFS